MLVTFVPVVLLRVLVFVLKEFFLTVKDLARSNDTCRPDGYVKWTKAEFQLHTRFSSC